METLAAISVSIAVITAWDDMQQAAWRPRIGGVIHGEQPAKRVEREMKWIPESSRDSSQLAAVGTTAIDVSPLPASAKCHSIRSDKFVVRTQILAAPEIHIVESI